MSTFNPTLAFLANINTASVIAAINTTATNTNACFNLQQAQLAIINTGVPSATASFIIRLLSQQLGGFFG
jgi:hypothetical protein